MGKYKVICPNCHSLTQADFPYCNYCGAKLKTVITETDEFNEVVDDKTFAEPQATSYYDEPAEQNTNAPTVTVAKTNLKDKIIQTYKKYPKRFISICVAVVIAIIAVIVIPIAVTTANKQNEEKLSDREQAIYQLVLDTSYKFKNPSSVRIISGQATYRKIDKDNKKDSDSAFDVKRGYYIAAHFRLSATNGWGATTTDYYFCGYDSDDGKLFVYDFDTYKELVPTVYEIMIGWADKIDDFDIDKINAQLDKKWNTK